MLGESIAAATLAIGEALQASVALGPLLTLAAAALFVVASLWWIYFDFMTGDAPSGTRKAQYFWGYAHYFLFAGAAVVGAGTALAVTWLGDHEHTLLPDWGVSLVIAGAVATFLMTVALIELVAEEAVEPGTFVIKAGASIAAIGAAFAAPVITVPGSMLVIAAILVALVAQGVGRQHRRYVSG